MLNVVKLKDSKTRIDDMLQRLNQSIDEVNSGRIDSCMITLVSKDGKVMSSWSPSSNSFTMLGAIEATKRNFIDSVVEDS